MAGRTGPRLLRGYLAASGSKQADIARALDVNRALVSEWVKGSRSPGTARRAQLAAYTKGAVPAESWETSEQKKEREAQAAILSRIEGAVEAKAAS